jgi:tRNA G10  N-methylase Trm11
MKYLFILGRNRDLSIAEIEEFFKKEENPINDFSLVENGLLVDVSEPVDSNVISRFGGTIGIGEIMASGDKNTLFKNMESLMIYDGTENKLNYTLWNFSDFNDDVLNYLKSRFKKEKLKATFKGLTSYLKMQGGEKEFIPSSKLIDFEYFIFEENGIQYFGKITQKCDYESLEKRDMEKPVRRESLAISPRLAKILINLAHLNSGDTLLDPFCGIGVILEEAMLQEVSVVGVDRDRNATKGAVENMKWFGFSEGLYEIINGDSTHVEIPNVKAVATEPDLGDILKKIPTKSNAEKTLRKFEKLMVGVINNVKNNVEDRIVFTSPYIRIGKKRLVCNIESICERTGYNLVRPGIPEYRGNQIVGRMIYILSQKDTPKH